MDIDIKMNGPRRRQVVPFVLLLSSILVGAHFIFKAVGSLSYSSAVLVAVLGDSLGGKLQLNDIYDGEYLVNRKSIQWLDTDELKLNDLGQYLTEDKGYYLEQVGSDNRTELFGSDLFEYQGETYDIDSFTALPNLEYGLVRTNTDKQWRHSSFGRFWLYKSGVFVPISTNISVTLWSPDSSQVAFVKQNNIFLFDVDLANTKRITQDGNAQVFNGKPDWVYEEEVWGGDLAMWWSPDLKKLAFVRSDDSKVPTYPLEFFAKKLDEDIIGNGTVKVDSYPTVEYLKYPKAGSPNPDVLVVVYDTNGDELTTNPFKHLEISNKNRVVIDVNWIGDELLTKLVNRNLTVVEYFYGNLLIHRDHTEGWFLLVETTKWIPANSTLHRENDGFLEIVLHDGWQHLAYIDPSKGWEPRLLTLGNWEVTALYGFDYSTNDVYFQLTRHDATLRTISKVNLFDTKKMSQRIQDIAKGGYYTGTISLGGRYLFQTYNGPNIPHQEIVDLHTQHVVQEVENNEVLEKNLKNVTLPRVSLGLLEITDKELGKRLRVFTKEYLPPKFDSRKRYPVIFAPYGGPYSQLTQQTFKVDFSMVLALQLDAIVLVVDNRGTGFNNLNNFGSNFTYTVKGRLGHYEPLDQIAAAEAYADLHEYVDRDRIGIWGWSFGGFLTLKVLENDFDHVFLFGVAIAPVTLWKFYDTVYTEMFLGVPEENPEGYATGLIQNVTNFSGAKRFMVAHGTGDDNVHIQNTYALLDLFNLEGIDNYDMMVFPDSDHLINFDNANYMVFNRIFHFFRRGFSGLFDDF